MATTNELRDNPEFRTWNDALVWLDQMPRYGKRAYDPWQIVEEAARLKSIETAAVKKFPDFENPALDWQIYGMAHALATICPVEGADASWWLGYITDYAEYNYTDGARNEE